MTDGKIRELTDEQLAAYVNRREILKDRKVDKDTQKLYIGK